MAKTREIRKRIHSVQNIHKITRTMEQVAQSKVMKLNSRFAGARQYRDRLLSLLPEALGAAVGSPQAAQELAGIPLCTPHATIRKVLLFCITSSRGLCGGYNAKVINATRARAAALAAEGTEVLLAVMGKKGLAYFRFHDQPVLVSLAETDERMPYERIDDMLSDILARYQAREYDAVEIIATRYRSKAVQEVRTEAFLPFTLSATTTGAAAATASATPKPGANAPAPLYLVEPSRQEILSTLVPTIVSAELFCTILEAMVSEQTQRSIAMRSASDNAESVTTTLTRRYNRARQAQITNEMIEIISGSEGGRE